jgi:6-phosphogluconolactonase (cycloisomerase 2 family)
VGLTILLPGRDAMYRTEPMNLDDSIDSFEVHDERKTDIHSAQCGLRGLVCALLCSLTCGCGGGSGSGTTPPAPAPPPPTTDSLLAVTNATAGSIDLLTIDTATGIPASVASSPMPDGPTPAAVAIDPLKRFLYVVSTSGELRAYVIVPPALNLTAVAGSPFSTGAQSVAIAVDPSGQFVLTANGSANTVSVFRIGSTGALTEVAGSPYAAGSEPSAIVIAGGQYVYAANTSGSSVSAYRLNTTSGAMATVAGSPFVTPGLPNGLVVDPAGMHLYASESKPNEMSGFAIDATTGALSTIPGSPFGASFAIRTPVIDAEGKRLHVANGSAVDCFTIDANTATLSEIGVSATNGQSSIALALGGPANFLYVLDNLANQIEVFSIDTSGALTLISGSPFTLFAGASKQNLGPNAMAVQH